MNWHVRALNPVFWMGLIPAVLLLVQSVLQLFGIAWDYSEINYQLLAIVEAAFGVLAILGVIADPTTTGLTDSRRAQTYAEPALNERDEAEELLKSGGNHSDHFTGGMDG